MSCQDMYSITASLFREGFKNSVQQRVEEVFSFVKISGNINALEALFEPIGLPQIGCPPGGRRSAQVYHRAASRLPLRANVIGNKIYINDTMIITICGSMKFADQMNEAEKNLKELGHAVFMPIKAEGVDYWTEDRTSRVAAKKGRELIGEHMDKIKQSEAILVINITKKDIENYIGANTFLEIGYAHYLKKKIFFLNPIPNQPYIIDEIETAEPQIINGDYSKIV